MGNYEAGLDVRRAVLGDEYVERSTRRRRLHGSDAAAHHGVLLG